MYDTNTAVTESSRFDPSMLNALQQYAAYEAAKNISAPPAFAQVKETDLEKEPAEPLKTASHGQDILTDVSLDVVDHVGGSAVNALDDRAKDLPSIGALASLGAGAAGRMGFAAMARTSVYDDVLDDLLPDEEVQEAKAETIEAEVPQEEVVAELTPQQRAMSAAAQINLGQIMDMHYRTAAIAGDKNALDHVLDQNDIALVDSLPDVTLESQGYSRMA